MAVQLCIAILERVERGEAVSTQTLSDCMQQLKSADWRAVLQAQVFRRLGAALRQQSVDGGMCVMEGMLAASIDAPAPVRSGIFEQLQHSQFLERVTMSLTRLTSPPAGILHNADKASFVSIQLPPLLGIVSYLQLHAAGHACLEAATQAALECSRGLLQHITSQADAAAWGEAQIACFQAAVSASDILSTLGVQNATDEQFLAAGFAVICSAVRAKMAVGEQYSAQQLLDAMQYAHSNQQQLVADTMQPLLARFGCSSMAAVLVSATMPSSVAIDDRCALLLDLARGRPPSALHALAVPVLVELVAWQLEQADLVSAEQTAGYAAEIARLSSPPDGADALCSAAAKQLLQAATAAADTIEMAQLGSIERIVSICREALTAVGSVGDQGKLCGKLTLKVMARLAAPS